MKLRAVMAYCGRGISRPRYHANDTSRDLLEVAPVSVDIVDARELATTLDEAMPGIALWFDAAAS